MATLFITEFEDLPGSRGGQVVQAVKVPPIAEQTVAIGVSTQSSAFNTNTKIVRLHTDAICSVKFGTNPTALTTSMRMAADTTEYFYVNAAHKVAVVTNT